MTDVPPLADLASFRWPAGKRAALSLTFDDARLTQADNGFEILDKHGVLATFYVVPNNVEKRLDAWKRAVARGHEIGNHTVTHPCGGSAAWSRHNALEDYTLERITREIDGATEKLKQLLGVTPKTFAYPCGQTWVGRGKNHRSYVPLIAERFTPGRGGSGQVIPGYADLALAPHVGSDRMTFEHFRSEIERAADEGHWLILVGHEIAADASKDSLTTFTTVLTEICKFATDPKNQIWIDTVEKIAAYVHEQRGAK
jgi:peptidoglycan/xylan/chitin deacetylase (PgdA/CDA1 family)